MRRLAVLASGASILAAGAALAQQTPSPAASPPLDPRGRRSGRMAATARWHEPRRIDRAIRPRGVPLIGSGS